MRVMMYLWFINCTLNTKIALGASVGKPQEAAKHYKLLAHSLCSRMGERIGSAKVRKLLSQYKDS